MVDIVPEGRREPSTMKLVFAPHAYAPAIGGAERYTQGIAEALVTMGHEVHVVAPNRVSAEAFYASGHVEAGPREQLINGVQVHRIRLGPSKLRSLGRKRSVGVLPVAHAEAMWRRYARALRREIGRIAPYATVTLPHAFPNVSAALGAPMCGVSVYAPLLHEEDPAWRIEPVADLVSKSDVVLAMTTWERARLVDAYGAKADRTFVAPPSVEAPDPDSVRARVVEIPYVVSIGRRTASKELTTTARAVQQVNAAGIPLRLIVAGPGDDADLDRELRSFGSSVEIIGAVSERDKWELIKGCVATVSMSAAESFGIGITEAWAMGRPAIARHVPAVASFVADGVDGLLVESEQELVSAITTLLTHGDRATRMGAAGRPKVRRTAESTASTVISAIDSVPAALSRLA